MKLAHLWSWLGRPNRRLSPAKRCSLELMKLEERAVPALFAVGSGGGPLDGTAKVFDDNGVLKATIKPFPIGTSGNYFKVGVDCSMGDVNHDGVPDLVVSAGPGGGPHVKVFDGKSINQIVDP